jgi:methylmalonyl-CoA mutase
LAPASENSLRGPRTWYHCPSIQVADPRKANEKALECLRLGADGVFFELTDALNFETLLADIEWSWCSLNFLAKRNQASIAKELHAYILKMKYPAKDLHGAYFGNMDPASFPLPFRFAGIEIPSFPSPVKEISDGFRMLIEILKNDFSQIEKVAFSINVGTDFFLEMAKLRAIRVVWQKFLDASKLKATPLFIHAHSRSWTDTRYQPHGNMLKSTTAAMAAILGGCNVLTVEPEDPQNPMMERVAQNVSQLLREEAYFSKVADPVAGSYFMEDLTHQLSAAAWQSIQGIRYE